MEMRVLNFEQVFKDSTRHFNKIPKSEYLKEGKYPIVDQSSDLISGYTNDESKVNKSNLPVLIFGDHTRIVKYVDYPVALGADGAKALEPKSEDFFPKYLHFLMKSKDIKSAGYSRHFKFLKQKKFEIPKTLKNQKRIAQVLSDCEELIQLRKQSIALLDELVKSTFLEMFGDPVRNKMGWNVTIMDEVLMGINSGYSIGGEPYKGTLKDDQLGVLKISAITSGSFDKKEIKVIERSKIAKPIVTLKKGMLLFSRANTFELIGASAIIDQNYEQLFIPDKLWHLETDESLILPVFLDHLLKCDTFRNTLREKASGGHSSMLNISMTNFKKLKPILPPIQLQKKFGSKIENIQQTKMLLVQHLQELENLYARLSQDAFKGELDLSGVKILETRMFSTDQTETPEDVLNWAEEKLAEKEKENRIADYENLKRIFAENNKETFLKEFIKYCFQSVPFFFDQVQEMMQNIDFISYNQYDYEDYKKAFFNILEEPESIIYQDYHEESGKVLFKFRK